MSGRVTPTVTCQAV